MSRNRQSKIFGFLGTSKYTKAKIMVGAKQQQRYLLKSTGKTKIVATLEPYNEDYSQIEAMVGSIIDGIRLDLSVGNNQLRAKQVDWINKAAKKQGKNLAIIMDLPGCD